MYNIVVGYIVCRCCLKFAKGIISNDGSYIVDYFVLWLVKGLSEEDFSRLYIKNAINVRKSFNVSTSNTIFTSGFEIKICIFITRF